jgi:PKD repeat protein
VKRPEKSLKLLTVSVIALFALNSSAYLISKDKQTFFDFGDMFLEKDNAPIAQFTTDKTEYKIGEPIEYIDLSYDPDLNGIYLSWEGKENAFFTPGERVVTLIAKNDKGQLSKPYTRTIKIISEVFSSKDEYPFYFGALNGDPNSVPVDLDSFDKYPALKPKEQKLTGRKLVVSNDPEIFQGFGLLYQEHLTGKARLYTTHVNGMKETAQVNVIASNPTSSPATIHITQKGEVHPSNYPALLGNQALVDWFANNQRMEERVLAPGESIIYYHSPSLKPDQGIHFIQDIDIQGEVVFSFLSTEPTKDMPDISAFKPFPRKKDVRGTYEVSELQWNADAQSVKGKPYRIIVGDESQWIPGKDALSGSDEKNVGNYGIFYDIHIAHPGKAAIAVVPRGGSLKGPVLFNNKIVLVPASGVVAPGTAYIIGRTTGKEEQIDITTCPPSGSSLPYDIFVYPLDDRKK